MRFELVKPFLFLVSPALIEFSQVKKAAVITTILPRVFESVGNCIPRVGRWVVNGKKIGNS